MKRILQVCAAVLGTAAVCSAASTSSKFHGSLGHLVHAHHNNQILNYHRVLFSFNDEYVVCSVVPRQGVSIQALKNKLRETEGVSILAATSHWVDAKVNFAVIESIHDWDEVAFIKAPFKPQTNIGSVTSQGVRSVNADVAVTRFNTTGSGITVGVVSDSADSFSTGLAGSIGTGDLPASARSLLEPDCTVSSCSDEGRAIGEVVFDVANDVELLFSTGLPSPSVFAEAIANLADEGANVIVDDFFYITEPFFFDGIVTNAAKEFISNGGIYVTSANNLARQSHENTFSAAANSTSNPFHDFGGGQTTLNFFTSGEGSWAIVLQWDQEWASFGGDGATSNLDLIVVPQNADGSVDCIENDATGQDPIKTCVVTSTFSGSVPFSLQLQRSSGNDSPFFKLFFNANNFILTPEVANSGTIVGHSNTRELITVGAVDYRNTPAFGGSLMVSPMSGFGGTRIRRNGFTQRPLATFVNTKKPDVVAPANVDTSFFNAGSDPDNTGFPNFPGSSAAAAHVAGVAALILEASINNDETPLNQFQVQRILKKTSIAFAGKPRQRSRGFINAQTAVARGSIKN